MIKNAFLQARIGSANRYLDALASLEPILFSQSVSQSLIFFWIADNLRIHHGKCDRIVPIS